MRPVHLILFASLACAPAGIASAEGLFGTIIRPDASQELPAVSMVQGLGARWAARLPLSADRLLPNDLLFQPSAVLPQQFEKRGFDQDCRTDCPALASDDRPYQQGIAVWNDLKGRTASGQRENPAAMTAGHRTLPFGSLVRVVNETNGRAVELRINDRGPVQKRFVLDMTRAAAERLGITGSAPVDIYLLRSGATGSAHAER